MLRLLLGGCGTGKSERLIEILQETIAAGKKPAVLVPDQFSFESEKKLCKALGTQRFNQVETYSFMTLSREILIRAGSSHAGSYASEQEKLIYLSLAAQQCEEQKCLESLSRRVGSSDFILELAKLVTKLRKAGVTAEQLLAAVPSLPDRLARKTQDIGQILLAYDRILKEHGRNDSLVNLTAAAELAGESDFFHERCFLIDEFDSFTGDQYQMLAVMLDSCPEMTVAIRCDDPTALPTGIFVGGNQTFYRLSDMAKDLSIDIEREYLGTYHRSTHADLALAAGQILRRHTASAPYSGHIRIASAADPQTEVEYICARICELLSKDTELHCRDIAIAVKQPEVYLPILKRAMVRYGLPFDTSEARSVLYSDLMRCTLTLFEILTTERWNTDTLLRYAKSPFSGHAANAVAMLEHFCFTWSIDRDDWETPFWSEEEGSIDLAGGFGGKFLETLREKLIGELSALRRACRGKSVRTVCGALYDHLVRKKKSHEKVLSAMTPTQQSEFIMIWNLLCDMFDTLVDCHGNAVLPLRHLYEEFLLLVQSSSFSVPPQMLDSIHIVDAQTARLDMPKILFVPGVVEGVLPGDVKVTGLFSQQELRDLEGQDISISRLLPELHSDELMIVVKLLCAPSEAIFLTYPITGQDGTACAPSSVIGEILGMFPQAEGLLLDADTLPVTFFVRSMASGYFTYVRRMHEDSEELAALREILMQDPVYAARLERLTRCPEAQKTLPSTMASLLGERIILSPSGIETFYQCAFQYFCRYVLHLYVPEQVTLSAQNIGNFTHFCLEQILRDTPMQEFLGLDREGLAALVSRYAQAFSSANFSDALRRSSRFQLNYRSTGMSLIELLQYLQDMFTKESFRPAGYEVTVSPDPGEGEFPALTLDGGRILCKGKIDRVDIYQDETTRLLRVVDYKTSDKSLVPLKVGYGLDMQMLVYLFALEQSGAFGSAAPSGVLYLPSGQLKQNRYEERSDKQRSRDLILRDYYMSRGLLLDAAAPRMDAELVKSAVPVRQAGSSDMLFTLSQQQLDHLRGHVTSTICQMAKKLQEGEIAAAPCRLPGAVPCKYCTFADLCGRADTSDPPKPETEQITAALDAAFGKEETDDADVDTPTE